MDYIIPIEQLWPKSLAWIGHENNDRRTRAHVRDAEARGGGADRGPDDQDFIITRQDDTDGATVASLYSSDMTATSG